MTKAWEFFKKYLVKPLVLIAVIALSAILVLIGLKKANIGGILGWIFGNTKEEENKPNTVPEDRVDSSGAPIPIGTPDDRGVTQAVVVPIETSDDAKVVLKDSEDNKVVVLLPEGVTDEDVHQVIVAKPVIENVTVKNTSKVSPSKVTDLIGKYGK